MREENLSSQFRMIPTDAIDTSEQVRRDFSIGDRFTQSVMDIGVLHPVLVIERGEGAYELICGMRRLQACIGAGKEMILARVFDSALSREQILLIQLTENSERKDLHPIENAKMLALYFSECEDVDTPLEMMGLIQKHQRQQKRCSTSLLATVATIMKISGKSARSLYNLFRLLTLPENISDMMIDGKIGLSQGYILAENLDHPDFSRIVVELVEKHFSNRELRMKFSGNHEQANCSIQKDISKSDDRENSLFIRLRTIRNQIESDKALDGSMAVEILEEVEKIRQLITKRIG